MTDLAEYEAAARWYCEQIGQDPDQEIFPGEGGPENSAWCIFARDLRDHDRMNQALKHGRLAKSAHEYNLWWEQEAERRKGRKSGRKKEKGTQ